MHTYISHIILNDLKLNPDLLHIKCQVPQGNTQNHWWHVFLERNLASGGIRYYRSWMPEICHMKTDLTWPRKMNSKLWLTRFSGRGRERQERDKRPGEGTPIQEKTGLCYKSRRPVGKRSVCYKTHLYERYRLHCSMICQLWLNLSRHITRWQISSHLMESLKSMSLKPLISLMGTYCTLT